MLTFHSLFASQQLGNKNKSKGFPEINEARKKSRQQRWRDCCISVRKKSILEIEVGQKF